MSDELPPVCAHTTKPEDRARPWACSICCGAKPKRVRAAEAQNALMTTVDARLSGAARAESRRSISRERQ